VMLEIQQPWIVSRVYDTWDLASLSKRCREKSNIRSVFFSPPYFA
jgi:hypothetical protein